MTSFAYILGYVALWTATGAGSVARQIMGTTVIGGIVAASAIGIFFVPAIFYLVEKLSGAGKKPLQAQSFFVRDLRWWQVFQDPKLQELIRKALEQNYDLQFATERINAARAQLLATEAARQTVVLTLVSDIASDYSALLDLDLQLQSTQGTVSNQINSVNLTTRRLQYGVATKLDVLQAQQVLDQANATVPNLERVIAQEENAISILLGNYPQNVGRVSLGSSKRSLPKSRLEFLRRSLSAVPI